ncbi:Similar to tr/P73196/P73196 (fragment) [Microcystis aeruginosa PCC 9443]|uniref:Similar to tr/P73196/P73196 n=1 Tax=Microcystis aeruginosa PCC 9443 TaxID=1160281 RepID=I4G8P7_MICAE
MVDSQAKIANLEGQLQELTQLPQQLETYRENIANLEIQLHQLSAEKDQLEATTSRHIEELSQQNRQITQDLEVQKTAAKALEKEKIKFESELATKQEEIAALEVQIQNRQQERDDFSRQTAPITTNELEAIISETPVVEEPETSPVIAKETPVVEEPETPPVVAKETPVVASEKIPVADTSLEVQPAAKIVQTSQESAENPLRGKTVVILGTFSQISREKAKSLIINVGGTVTGSPSANTDYILLGKAPGEKLKKAQKLGIKTLSEAQFLQMVELL